MRALAREWGCDASNATWVVDRLEERGLAERRTPQGEAGRAHCARREDHGPPAPGHGQPPPELLQLDRAALEALRDAAAEPS